MVAGIGAAGIVGVAREATIGTYLAPEKFIPIRSESLQYMQETKYTRPIRGVADPVFAVDGPSHVEGDIEFEVTHDTLPYLLYGMRGTVAKVGTASPWVYTLTPDAAAQKSGAQATLSISVDRNGEVFGYLGCVITALTITVDDGILVATCTILGEDEATQAALSEVWPTVAPFGAGMYDIEIPTASAVLDADTFSFSVDDSGEVQHRLNSTSRAPQFIAFGERTTELTVERDFDDRTDMDAFKALTAQEITVKATLAAGMYVYIVMQAVIKDTYEVGLSGQGDLIRASIAYQGIYEAAATEAYNIAVSTSEDIT